MTVSSPASALHAEMLFSISAQVSVLQASENIEELLGHCAGDFLSGKTSFMDLIHADDQDIAGAMFSHQALGAVQSCNIRLRQANGRIRCVKATYQRHALAEGIVLELLLLDARRLLRTMGDPLAMVNFRAMMENTDDYIYFKDRNHVFTGASQTLVSLCEPAEHWTDLIGQTDYDVFPEDYADLYYRLEKQVFAGTPVAHEVQKFLTREGRSGWVDNRKYPIRDERGEIVGLYGIARDVTERILTEESLLLQSNILQSMDECFNLVRTRDEMIVFANPRFERMFGYEPRELLGRHVSTILAPNGQSANDIASGIIVALAQSGSWVGEVKHIRKDGSVFWCHANVTTFEHPEFGPVWVAVHQDITARRAAEIELAGHRNHLEKLVLSRTAELAAARDAAESANIAKTAFLANMSHELRTPMNGIMGMTDLALRRATDPKQQGYLVRVQQASGHLLTIINDILDISRIEADRLILDAKDFSLAVLADEVTGVFGPEAAAHGLMLQAELEPLLGDLRLRGDPVRLRQILLNLTGNALKFTKAGSVKLQVRLLEESETRVKVRFAVRDTGIGIAVDDLENLFTPFHQVDNSMTRGYGGTGLGLSICKRLVEAMGGRIGLESQPGEGSTFWFTLNLAKTAPPSLPTLHRASAAEAILQSQYVGARILVAEDEPISQEVVRFLLGEVGLLVDVADDGEKALEMVRQGHYDLVLMDMQLPRMNGLDATRGIRALPGHENLPIVAMTANAFDEDRLSCLDAGMTDFLAKPVAPEVLYAAVLRGLAREGVGS